MATRHSVTVATVTIMIAVVAVAVPIAILATTIVVAVSAVAALVFPGVGRSRSAEREQQACKRKQSLHGGSPSRRQRATGGMSPFGMSAMGRQAETREVIFYAAEVSASYPSFAETLSTGTSRNTRKRPSHQAEEAEAEKADCGENIPGRSQPG